MCQVLGEREILFFSITLMLVNADRPEWPSPLITAPDKHVVRGSNRV